MAGCMQGNTDAQETIRQGKAARRALPQPAADMAASVGAARGALTSLSRLCPHALAREPVQPVPPGDAGGEALAIRRARPKAAWKRKKRRMRK